MTKINKLALLAGVVGVFGATSAHAAAYNGDLIVGFADGVGNDLVYDLGSVASVTNGATWNLASLTGPFTLSTVNWGVIGNSAGAGTSRLLYTTFGSTPATAGAGTGGLISGDQNNIYGNFTTAGSGQHCSINPNDDNSWNRQTVNPTLSTQYLNAWENPNAVGIVTINFWKVQANSSAPILLGAFNLAANGTLKFVTNSVTSGPPAPQIVSLTRLGNISTVAFTTTNGSFTYSLHFTNATGLTSPLNTWPTSATTVIGNGSTQSIPDTTTDTNRFYSVGVH